MADAARTIEVLDQVLIKSTIKTRMGASLSYNAIWTTARLRGRENDPEYTVNVSVSKEPTHIYPGASVADDLGSIATDMAPLDTILALQPTMEQVFPWRIWDDAVYDQLGFVVDEQSFSGFSGALDIF